MPKIGRKLILAFFYSFFDLSNISFLVTDRLPYEINLLLVG